MRAETFYFSHKNFQYYNLLNNPEHNPTVPSETFLAERKCSLLYDIKAMPLRLRDLGVGLLSQMR